MISILGDMKMYGRFAWGRRGFLRRRITLEEARAIVQQRLAERDTNFLRLVESGIFGYARSSYLPLLKMAGCELGDIRNMVKDRGLEDTRRALREAGVYITLEEFKGREPIVLEALEHSSVAANLARVFWSQAGTLQIKRMEPIWTARGKMMPIHVVRQPERSSS